MDLKLNTGISKYVLFVLSVHLLVLSSIYFNIPVLRQVLVFAYLLFVPGFFLLVALKIEKTDALEVVLISIGLSVAILMFVGYLINELYPILGISQPLSTIPLISTICVVTLALSVLGLRSDSQEFLGLIFSTNENLKGPFFKAIPLVLIPVIGLTGAIYRDLTVPLLIIAVAVLFILSMLSTRLIPRQLYPLLIFSICLALALQFTLMSQHIMGNDAPLEYRVYQLTSVNERWESLTTAGQVEIYYNSMLSITIFPTIFSVLLNVNGELLFKVLFPMIFSLVPLVLYKILVKQALSSKASLLAALFLISSPIVFYGVEPLSINRQIIGQFFFILSMLLIFKVEDRSNTKNILLVVFGAALAVSHYSLTFIYLGYLVYTLFISKLTRKSVPVLSVKFVLLMFVIALSWYLSYASPLLPSINSTFINVLSNFQSDFSNPAARSSDLFASHQISNIASVINWVVFALVHFFIVVGILLVIFAPKFKKIGFNFKLIVFFSSALMFLVFAVPNFAPILNFSRFYAMSMLFLAPCFVLGGEGVVALVKYVFAKVPRHKWNLKSNLALVLIAILASSYFLSQSGFVNHVLGGSTLSTTLAWDRTIKLNMSTSFEPAVKVGFYVSYTPHQDVLSAKWLATKMSNDSLIFADSISIYHPLHVFALIQDDKLVDLTNDTQVPKNSYVYLRTFNFENGFIIPIYHSAYNISELNSELNKCNLVYTNGYSVVYKSPD